MALSACLRERNSWYVLVDPIIDDPLAKCDRRDQAIPLPIPHAEIPPQHRPYLLELGEIGRDERIDLTIQLAATEAARLPSRDGSKRSICGWIASDEAGSTLARHLARHARLYVQGRPKMFRIWDPRTLDLLTCLLADDRMRALVTPAFTWQWLGRDGGVKALSATGGSHSPDAEFSIGEDQLEMLLLAESVNATLNVLQDAKAQDAQGGPVGDDALYRVVGALRRATRQWALSDPLDQVRFALHACFVHRDFDSDTEVASAMQASMRSGRSAVEALSLFDEQAWRVVRHRLEAMQPDLKNIRKEGVHHG